MKLTYNDTTHAYWIDGKRAKSATAVAKIPVDTFNIEQWDRRQLAIGFAMDRNLVEKVAVDVDNRDALNQIVEEAKQAAKAHLSADRGTQMHRVLQLVLLDQEDKLLTEQQRADAELLKRILDRYRLTPHDGLTEQFVTWPEHTVAGRFDAVFEKSDGTTVLTDLKSGPNAVTYPHATAVQLALYARAPHISESIVTVSDRSTVTEWRPMPDRLDLGQAYVLLAEPDSEVGTLHAIDIEHGWIGAQLALQIVNWRKDKDYGRGITSDVPAQTSPSDSWVAAAHTAAGIEELRQVWRQAKNADALTPDFLAACEERRTQFAASA